MMLHASDILDIDVLDKLVEDRFVNRIMDSSNTLAMYTTNTNTNAWRCHHWSEEAIIANGLILDTEYNVVARPFNHIFQWSKYEGTIPTDKAYKVQGRVSGLTGILYRAADGHPSIADPSGFENPLATQDFYAQKLDQERIIELIDTHTPVFSMVKNQTNTQYTFCLLSIVNKTLGTDHRDLASTYWSGMVPLEATSFNVEEVRKIANLDKDGQFLIKFGNGLKLVANFQQFLALKRMEGITPNYLWEHLNAHRPYAIIEDRVPREFLPWARGILNDMTKKFAYIAAAANNEFNLIWENLEDPSKKAFAKYAQKSENSSILFALYENISYDKLIWHKVRPKFEVPYKYIISPDDPLETFRSNQSYAEIAL